MSRAVASQANSEAMTTASTTPEAPRTRLIELKRILVIALQRWILPLFAQQAVADGEHLDVSSHEAAEGVLGRRDDRLAAHVEAGVDQHRAASACLERAEERVEARIGLVMHRLDARRIIDVGDRRDRRAHDIELVDAEEAPLRFAHRALTLLLHRRDEQHVRAVGVEIEPLGHVLAQHRRCEGAEALAELDLEIEQLLHGRRARVAEDRACAERARSELHATLEPADGLALDEGADDAVEKSLVIERLEIRANRREPAPDLVTGVGRTEICPAHAVAGVAGDARPIEKEVIGAECGADRAAGIARSRLNPDLLEGAVAQHLAVGDAVERDAAGKAEIGDAGLARLRTRDTQHDLLGNRLQRRGDIHVEVVEPLRRLSRWAAEQRVEAPVRHFEAGAIVKTAKVEAKRAVLLEIDDMGED